MDGWMDSNMSKRETHVEKAAQVQLQVQILLLSSKAVGYHVRARIVELFREQGFQRELGHIDVCDWKGSGLL
jgi:hypothetical protein